MDQTQIPNQKLRMSFYDASDGPRIMLFGPMDVDIGALQQTCRMLSHGNGSIQLDAEDFIVPFGGIRLLAKSSGPIHAGAKHEGRQGILKRSKTSPQFDWIRSREGWDYLAELIDSLVHSKIAAHQYLTQYPRDDAIVVVSKGEYSDDMRNLTVA